MAKRFLSRKYASRSARSDQLMPVFLSRKELDAFGEELDQYRNELFKTEYLPLVKSFPKVRELFERIKQDGKKIVLASSAKEDELKTYKKIAQVEDLTDADTSSEDAEKSKPHPRHLRKSTPKRPVTSIPIKQ